MNVLKGITKISFYAERIAAGSASHWGGCQPKEPDLINLSRKDREMGNK